MPDSSPSPKLTPDLLLRAYAAGIFPMAEHAEAEEIFWLDPRRRGVLPLEGVHVSHSLARRIRRAGYEVTLDADFEEVLRGCANRPETWINPEIFSLYMALHRRGHAHSIEIMMDGALAGGIYGVTLGGAFFGESMFSRRTDASKLALVHLAAHLSRCGFTLFDTQFITPHLARMGAVEISRAAYHRQLKAAIRADADWHRHPRPPEPQTLLQRRTQTS